MMASAARFSYRLRRRSHVTKAAAIQRSVVSLRPRQTGRSPPSINGWGQRLHERPPAAQLSGTLGPVNLPTSELSKLDPITVPAGLFPRHLRQSAYERGHNGYS